MGASTYYTVATALNVLLSVLDKFPPILELHLVLKLEREYKDILKLDMHICILKWRDLES